jgi:hypothetical protein
MRQRGTRLAKAALVSVGSFGLFGVVTGLIPNPVYVRMVPRTGLDYLFLLLTAAFLGLYVLQRTPGRTEDDTAAGAGAVVGFLAFGCPICNAFLLALFSSSALMTYLDPLRPLLGAGSVLLFGGLLYVRSQRTCEQCVDGEATGSTLD